MKYRETIRLLGALGYLDGLQRRMNKAQDFAETPEDEQILAAVKEVVRYLDKNALMYDNGAVLEKHLTQEEIDGLGKLFKEHPLLKKLVEVRDIMESDIAEAEVSQVKIALRRMGVASDRVDYLLNPNKKPQKAYDVQ